MALTLIATPGAANANTYATIAEANAYHETRLYNDTWNGQSVPAREQALVWATRLLDQHLTWQGAIASSTQALRWPRVSTYDRDGRLLTTTAIPDLVKQATAELARWLLDADRPGEQTGDEDARVASVSLGSLEVTYAGEGSAAGSGTVIPSAVIAMLAPVGSYTNAPGMSGPVSVRRG